MSYLALAMTFSPIKLNVLGAEPCRSDILPSPSSAFSFDPSRYRGCPPSVQVIATATANEVKIKVDEDESAIANDGSLAYSSDLVATAPRCSYCLVHQGPIMLNPCPSQC